MTQELLTTRSSVFKEFEPVWDGWCTLRRPGSLNLLWAVRDRARLALAPRRLITPSENSVPRFLFHT